MTEFLPRPEVMRCFFDATLAPHFSAMELAWHPDAPGTSERVWHLPQGVSLRGPAPARFGVVIDRHAEDAYKVQVLWNQLFLAWCPLTRAQVMAGSLSLILKALGTDLWALLHQPVQTARRAA